MYNEERKQKFLDKLRAEGCTEKYVKGFYNLFNKIEKYEQENECDISEFKIGQIMRVYDDFNVKTSSAVQYNRMLMRYSPTTEIEKVGKDLLEKLAKEKKEQEQSISAEEKVVSHNKVKNFIATLERPVDKFLIYGTFCGILGASNIELFFSSMKDSDKETGLIWLAGYNENNEIDLKHRQFYADSELFEIAQESCQSKVYVVKTKDGVVKELPLICSDPLRIIKTTKAKDENKYDTYDPKSTIWRKYQTLVKDTEFEKYSLTNIYWSGVVYNIKKIALEYNIDKIVLDDIISMPEFDQIRKQYDLQMQDRSLLPRLEWYFK